MIGPQISLCAELGGLCASVLLINARQHPDTICEPQNTIKHDNVNENFQRNFLPANSFCRKTRSCTQNQNTILQTPSLRRSALATRHASPATNHAQVLDFTLFLSISPQPASDFRGNENPAHSRRSISFRNLTESLDPQSLRPRISEWAVVTLFLSFSFLRLCGSRLRALLGHCRGQLRGDQKVPEISLCTSLYRQAMSTKSGTYLTRTLARSVTRFDTQKPQHLGSRKRTSRLGTYSRQAWEAQTRFGTQKHALF